MEKEKEFLHWADNMAREVKARADNDPILKKIVKKEGYIVYDEKTPSGIIHIGSGRGWVIHDAIAIALRDLGLKGRFILSSDDIDPFDKLPTYIDKKYEKYTGMPFRNIPSPVDGYESYADYYFMQVVEKFEEFGIEAEIQSTGEVYESGKFNKAIKTILDNHKKVKEIFERIYDKEYNRFPFNPICEECGKIATTKGLAWDPDKELVTYKCLEDYVPWAEGCGHESEISPYDGNGKLPWKVEWAAKWPTIGVVCELAGKDHFTKGGSREVAINISHEVLKFPPPYPSTPTKIGKGYEFFNVGGTKMSTSKGKGIGFAEITEYVPAKILRYLLIKTRPHAVLDFDPYRPNDMILLYDRFDKTERIFFGKEKVDEREQQNQKRIYELSHIGQIPDRLPAQVSLSLASMAIQIGLDEEGAIKVLKKTGHIAKEVEGIDQHYVLERLHDARRWVDKFASEDYKFTLQEKVSVKLSPKQKKALTELAKLLHERTWKEKELHDEFYNITKKVDIEVKEFFKAAYSVLINKERGPRLASFILTIGPEKVSELFKSV